MKASICFALAAAVMMPAFAQQHVSNPFVGAVQYVNPDYAKEVQAVMAQTTDPVLKAQMNTVTTYPTAVWLDRIAAIAGSSATGGRLGLTEHLDTALQQAAGRQIVVTLVIYDLPQRDCAARASNGELSIAANPPTQPLDGLTTYRTQYINVIGGILANQKYATIRFVLVIEPDSLPNLVTNTGSTVNLPNCAAAQSSGVYVQGIQHAINTFSALPNAYLYLDIGHSAWLGWPNNAQGAVRLYTTVVSGTTRGLASIDGFIDNTANYTPLKEPFIDPTRTFNGQQLISASFYEFNPTVDEAGYATELQTLFRQNNWPASSTNFITDTSRNGWGGPNRPTAASTSTDLNTFVNQSRIDKRNHRGQWCNQNGAGLGIPPLAAPPDFPQFQAYVWIKPPGESDGTYPGSANQNGALRADPNCDPAQTNPLAGNTLIGSIPDSPPAGEFFPTEFIMNVRNAFPAVPTSTAPDFTVFGNGTSVQQGGAGTTSITILPVNGFNGTVALSAAGMPAGVTASFSPASIANGSGVSTLTFTAAANATVPATPTPITITATGTQAGTTITHTATINLTVIGRPEFTISVNPTSLTLPPGTNPTVTLTVSPLFGFTGTVSLSASGLPAGVSANFSPSSVNGSGTIIVNFNAQTSTPAGTTNISLNGVSGSLSHSATLALTIPGAANFSLSASPAAVTVSRGGTATSGITVTPSGGFTGSVTLSASGLPSGVTASFAPNPTTGTSTLTFTASATATTGTASVTVTGVSGSLTHTTTISLTVPGQPDFSLSATNATVTQGGAGTSTVSITPVSGFTGSVTLSTGTLPAGVTASFSPNPATGMSTLTFTAGATATTGPATVTITGTSGMLTHSASITLTVNANQPDFSLTGTSATVTQGSTGTSTITVNRINGFTGNVTLSAGPLPAGVTASFNPNPTATTSTLTFTATATATTGAATVTVTGTSGTLSHTTNLTLTVSAGNNNGNGSVTVTPVINSNQPWFDDEGVRINNTAPITALSITITVQNTGGISFSGQYNTVGGAITQNHSSTATSVVYQFALAAGSTLTPGSYLFDAQMGGNGMAHPTGGDTFIVTYTVGGTTFTQSGHF